MATEVTKFDTDLKEKLYRDLLFRGFTLTAVSSIASYYAIHIKYLEPLQLLIRTVDSLSQIINTVGSIAVFLAIAALLFKDLDENSSQDWGQTTKKGYFGGIIRRFADDLTLWTLGAVVTVFNVLLVSIIFSNISISEIVVLLSFGIILCSWIAMLSYINILVRRREPTLLASKLTKPHQLLLTYGITLMIMFTTIFVFK
jgi:hypothetical protein